MGNQRECMLACAAMLEKYDSAVRKLPIYNNTAQLTGEDLNVWKNVYFPTLVEGGLVEDYRFFGDGKNVGIGNDGIFQKGEYCHFMYRLYKRLITDTPPADNYMVRYIRDCANMFEPFVEPYRKKVNNDKTSTLNTSDMNRWKTDFQLYLCNSGLIEDGGYFIEPGRDGIGDGIFVATELLHILFRLYQYIAKMRTDLPVWKCLVFHCVKTSGGSTKCDALPNDAMYVRQNADRFARFMFAFSGGKVLFDIAVQTVTREVALTQDGKVYWLDCLNIKDEINRYAPNKTVDIIFGVSRYGTIPVGNWGGLSTGIHPYANYAGYCVTRFFDDRRDDEYLIPSVQKPPKNIPHPEEFMVHEALHVLDFFYTQKYGKVPNPDRAGEYKYPSLNPNGFVGGFYKFYADSISCKVMDPSLKKLIGVTEDMWKHKPSNE